jgi:hypothetical protein
MKSVPQTQVQKRGGLIIIARLRRFTRSRGRALENGPGWYFKHFGQGRFNKSEACSKLSEEELLNNPASEI